MKLKDKPQNIVLIEKSPDLYTLTSKLITISESVEMAVIDSDLLPDHLELTGYEDEEYSYVTKEELVHDTTKDCTVDLLLINIVADAAITTAIDSLKHNTHIPDVCKLLVRYGINELLVFFIHSQFREQIKTQYFSLTNENFKSLKKEIDILFRKIVDFYIAELISHKLLDNYSSLVFYENRENVILLDGSNKVLKILEER